MDPRVLDLLRRAAAALEPLGLPYSIGGAIAMHAHGYARYTSDIDVFALDEHRTQILRAFRTHGLTVEPVFSPHHYIAYLPEQGELRVRVDISFPAAEPELSAIEFPVRAQVMGTDINVFPLSLLVAAKFYSDRPEDHHDLAALLNRGLFDPDEVVRMIASIDPEGAADFVAEIAELRRPRPPRKRPPKRT